MPGHKAEGQGCHTFRVSKSTSTVRKRARFDPKRRGEVKAVRQRRSCLRCALLKIKCSDDDRCTTCEQLVFVNQNHARKTLSFSGCIRTRLREVSIFEICLSSPGSEIVSNDPSLDSTLATISLEFGSLVTWDLEALVEDVVKWLNNPTESETSKVGTLSSPQFLNIVRIHVEDQGASHFQKMIYAITRAYTRYDGPLLTVQELSKLGSASGHQFLTYLDEKLKPTSLARSSVDELRILFLWVFGTILAVGYAVLEGTSKGDTMSGPGQTFSSMQNHLCQILAHYLIFIAARLGLLIKSGMGHFILEKALAKWSLEGSFEWKPSGSAEICNLDGCFACAARVFRSGHICGPEIQKPVYFDCLSHLESHEFNVDADTENEIPRVDAEVDGSDMDEWKQWLNIDLGEVPSTSMNTWDMDCDNSTTAFDTGRCNRPPPSSWSQPYRPRISQECQEQIFAHGGHDEVEQPSEYRPPECDTVSGHACLYVSERKKPRVPRPRVGAGCVMCGISYSHGGTDQLCRRCVRFKERRREMIEDQYLLV